MLAMAFRTLGRRTPHLSAHTSCGTRNNYLRAIASLSMSFIMRVLLLPLCCLLAIVSFAQTSATDSLEQRFSEEKDAAKRLELLSQMTNLAFGADFKAALGYAKRGMALSKQTGDKNWQPKFYEMTGRMHANLLHLDSANLFFDKATSAYRAVGNRRGEATTAFKIAWGHKRKGEMKEAMAADLQALRIMEELGDQEGIA
ncbi:MAG TPA: hypothetical protein PKL59_23185, partial [Nitrospira sp.]|nr:hypothetical protein [Nitrospira sp.]